MKTSISHVTKPAAAGVHAHTQYVVRVADTRSETTAWLLYKRYSEFRQLRDALLHANLCESCTRLTKENYITNRFPRRHLFTSSSERVLDERKIGLGLFLDIVTIAVRRCTDPACSCRMLLEDFLVLPEMRYTFIDVQLEGAASEKITVDQPSVTKEMQMPEPETYHRHSLPNMETKSLLEFNRKDRTARNSFPGKSSAAAVKRQAHRSSSERIKRLKQEIEALSLYRHAPAPRKMKPSLATIEEVEGDL
ncbi:hypothetical protein THRCLA_02555 [Thraustotheca clavata]|uniref:PX domain-containing protein n=1 Tax=Thraustotheca clavata TaxID=74557 RepID=A0A1W0A534_9STRA|nr:hypothetical protein THRCLA_02555 [Thraustotheca clavata]